jgi:hypothetical protein
LFSKKSLEGTRKHEEDYYDRCNYQDLNLICLNKENAEVFDDIDNLIKSILVKSKYSSYKKQVTGIFEKHFFNNKPFTKRLRNQTGIRIIFGNGKMKSVKKILPFVLSFIMFFAVLDSVGSFDIKDAVDSNVTDMDSSADSGVENNFPNAQDIYPDSNNMNIQESYTYGVPSEEDLYVNAYDSTYINWIPLGVSPYLDTVDTSNIIKSKSEGTIGWFDFPATTKTGYLTVDAEIYVNSWEGDVLIEFEWTGDTTADASIQTTGTTSNWYELGTVTGLDNATEVDNCRIRAVWAAGKNNWIEIDAFRLEVSESTDSYEIDFEYNWSNADYDESNEEICFYVSSHTGNENLNVSYWSGSWTYLGQITNTGWTNLTATGLSDATYEIQLKGDNESSDSIQDDWNIDVIMLHTWTTPTVPIVLTNFSTGVEENNATLNGYLQSNGSADTATYFLWDNDASGEPYANNQSNSITVNLSEFQFDATSLTSGDLYYFNTKANNSAGWDDSGGELTFFTKPPAVTSFIESASTNTSLTYTWTEATVGSGATAYSKIQYKTGSNPTSISDGTNTYNGTDETDNTGSLNPGTHYYFSAFSWGTESTVGNWNDTYDTMDAWTNPGDPTSISTTNGTNWINVTFTHGTNGSYTMIRRNTTGSADYPADRSSGVLVDNTTHQYANDISLNSGITYYYSLWTWDPDGKKWCDNKITIAENTSWNTSIEIIPEQWIQGNIWIGDINATTGFYFNLTNEGNVALNIQINASNATNSSTGAEWKLNSTPSNDNFTLQYNKSGGGTWTNINTTYDVFVTNLDVNSWQTFDLKLIMATESSTEDPLSFEVTFKSVKA